MGNYAASTALGGGHITFGGLVTSGVLGGIAGAIGGPGYMHGNSFVNSFVAFGGKYFFKDLIINLGVKALISDAINAVGVGGMLDGLYSRIVNDFNLNPNRNFWGW